MITRLGLATFSMWKRVIGEIRNPKAENRRKAEIRIPKGPSCIPAMRALRAMSLADLGASFSSATAAAMGMLASAFGFRISFGFPWPVKSSCYFTGRVSLAREVFLLLHRAGFGFRRQISPRTSRIHNISPLPILLCITVAATSALGQSVDDKQATFFMGRVRYSSSDGNDCSG